MFALKTDMRFVKLLILSPPPPPGHTLSAFREQKVSMCKECIEWAKENKRRFLRQALEVRPDGHRQQRLMAAP